MKSPYQRSNRTWRARGPALVITALILLVAAGAYVTLYTKGLQTTEPQATQTLDPVEQRR